MILIITKRKDPFARRLFKTLMLVEEPRPELPLISSSFEELMNVIQKECSTQVFLPILLVDDVDRYLKPNQCFGEKIQDQVRMVRRCVFSTSAK